MYINWKTVKLLKRSSTEQNGHRRWKPLLMGDCMRRSQGVRVRHSASHTHSLDPPQRTPCKVGVEAIHPAPGKGARVSC